MLNYLTDPSPDDIGDNIESFLSILSGPSCIIINGKDNSRTRAFVTLLHGNEPSGIMAIFRWIKEQHTPAVRIVCIIASVTTALQAPLFHYRTLPGRKDLNRCFQPPFDGEEGTLAKAILDEICKHQPEAVIDMHNTSGSGPAFGVATHQDKKHEILTQVFSQQLIITHIKLGALMDISEDYFPTVTIEAGGRLDQSAHDIAWRGVFYFFSENNILKENKLNKGTKLLIEPVRIELNNNSNLSYAASTNQEFNITLKHDIDSLNFRTIDSNIELGWINQGGLESFSVKGNNCSTNIYDWLQIKNGKLYPAKKIKLFMITTDPVIAVTDCLFYGVSQ